MKIDSVCDCRYTFVIVVVVETKQQQKKFHARFEIYKFQCNNNNNSKKKE